MLPYENNHMSSQSAASLFLLNLLNKMCAIYFSLGSSDVQMILQKNKLLFDCEKFIYVLWKKKKKMQNLLNNT